jgi:hypothetical protein
LTGENRGGGGKKLTTPLTFVLSRKGRGEIKRVKRIPLNFLPIDGGG